MSARPYLRTVAVAVALVLLAPPWLQAQPAPAVDAADHASGMDPDNEESGVVRWREWIESLTGGIVPDEASHRAMWQHALAARSESRELATSAVNAWQLVGPIYSTNAGGGRMTGRVRDIDANRVRVLAASGGLWRFSFGAIAMDDSVPASWYGSFAVHPSNANVMLLGTGEPFIGTGTGLYKTNDGGATWQLKTMSGGQWYSRIRYSPDASIVHAAAAAGYFRSTDGGETWTRTLTGTVTDLATVPGSPGLVFAVVSNGGLWRSTNDGASWSQITTGGLPASTPGAHAVTAIRTPSGAVWIYVVLRSTLWRSQDGGGTWTNITPGYTVGYSNYGPTISVCPSDPNVVLYGDVSYNRTTNAGANWTSIASPHLHADYHVFAWKADGVGVYAGHDGGWSYSPDAGLTWDTSSNVMPVTQFYHLDTQRNENGLMIGGTQDNNTLYTPNQSLFWSDPIVASTEGDAFGVGINAYDPNQMWSVTGVFGAPQPFQRYRTVNGGVTWTPANTGIEGNNDFGGQLRTDNAFPVRLYSSAGQYVYESTDGATWTKTNAVPFPNNVRRLTASTRVSGGAVLYATFSSNVAGQRLYVRDNGTWYDRSGNLPPGSVIKVVPHPWAAFASEAWAIMTGAGAGNQIFYTLDRGVTWTNITGDFPASQVLTDFAPNPRSSQQHYVSTLVGVWRTLNGGVNWERWTNGMHQGANVSELSTIDLTQSGGAVWIVAATYGRSVWKRAVTGEDPHPSIAVGQRFQAEQDDGTSSMIFRVELSAPSSETVTVQWATADSTANAPGDYQSSSGTLVFAPGQIARYLSVGINGDPYIEPTQHFKVLLFNPIGAMIAGPGVGTIEDDDSPGLVQQDMWVTDGAVHAIVPDGDHVYLGGAFNRIGTPGGGGIVVDSLGGAPVHLPRIAGVVHAAVADGSGGWFLGGTFTHVGGVPRSNLARLDAAAQLTDWNPGCSGSVFTLLLDGATLYVGGQFTAVGIAPRNNLAALDAPTGIATDWNPNVNGLVTTVAVNATHVYAGGEFTLVGGQSRVRLAAIRRTTGASEPWFVSPGNQVEQVLLHGSTLYVCGFFTTLGGQPRSTVGAVDVTTGPVTGWNPAPDFQVLSMTRLGSTLFMGGTFTAIAGQPRSYAAAFDATTGALTPWHPNANGPVSDVHAAGGRVYAQGSFGIIGGQGRAGLAALEAATGMAIDWIPQLTGTVGAFAAQQDRVFLGGAIESVGWVTRNRLASIDVTTGQVTSWNPNVDGTVLCLAKADGVIYAGGGFFTVGGQARSCIVAIDPVTGAPTAWNPNANNTVRCLLPASGRLYVGGSFSTIGGQSRSRIAALSPSTGLALSWNPNANGVVYALGADATYVYAGGIFNTIGGQLRNWMAQLTIAGTGIATPWNAQLNERVTTIAMVGSGMYFGGRFTQVVGQTRNRAAVVDNTTGLLAGWNPNANGDVHAITRGIGSRVYVGGAFTTLAGLSRTGLAEVSGASGSPSDWAPQPDGAVNAIATEGQSIYVGGSFVRIAGTPQSYFARLVQSEVVDVADEPLPARSLALSVSPNPAREELRLEFALPRDGVVRVTIHDVQGRHVATAMDGALPAGRHGATWRRPPSAGPGLYFARVEADGHTATQRFVVLR